MNEYDRFMELWREAGEEVRDLPSEEEYLDVLTEQGEPEALLGVLSRIRGRGSREHELKELADEIRPEFRALAPSELVDSFEAYYSAMAGGSEALLAFASDERHPPELREFALVEAGPVPGAIEEELPPVATWVERVADLRRSLGPGPGRNSARGAEHRPPRSVRPQTFDQVARMLHPFGHPDLASWLFGLDRGAKAVLVGDDGRNLSRRKSAREGGRNPSARAEASLSVKPGEDGGQQVVATLPSGFSAPEAALAVLTYLPGDGSTMLLVLPLEWDGPALRGRVSDETVARITALKVVYIEGLFGVSSVEVRSPLRDRIAEDG